MSLSRGRKDTPFLADSFERPPVKPPLVGDAAVHKFLTTFEDSYIPAANLTNETKIGAGSYAVVWKCEMRDTKGVVAVKQMNHNLFRKEDDVVDFFRETQLLQTVSHDNIVQFRGVTYADFLGEGKKSLCVVQEYMNMGSLKKAIQRRAIGGTEESFTAQEGIGWMIQVANAMLHLHNPKATIIHRDLKPSNILLNRNEQLGKIEVKIADFGLSVLVYGRDKMLERVNTERKPAMNRIKRFGSVVKSLSGLKDFFDNFKKSDRGDDEISADNEAEKKDDKKPTIHSFHSLTEKTGSFAYMAPEVFRSQQYNEKVDVFSFGIILYEIIDGRHPFLKFAMTAGNPRDVRTYAERVSLGYRPSFPKRWPLDIKILIADCLHDSPGDRPSMRVVLQRLEAIYELGVMETLSQTATVMQKNKPVSCQCCVVQ